MLFSNLLEWRTQEMSIKAGDVIDIKGQVCLVLKLDVSNLPTDNELTNVIIMDNGTLPDMYFRVTDHNIGDDALRKHSKIYFNLFDVIKEAFKHD